MNKYQLALKELEREFQMHDAEWKQYHCSKSVMYESFKELVDRAEEQFTHILHVRKEGFPTRIAFHTSAEAEGFAHKMELRGCRLESIQFGKMEETK